MVIRLTRKKKLGKIEKKLMIRLLKRRENYYDIVLVRKRAKATSRLCRLGYYELIQRARDDFSVLALDFKRISVFISQGVYLDSSFSKLIIN